MKGQIQQKIKGNDEAEGGANPQLSRNCDGNESRERHWKDSELFDWFGPIFREGR